MLHNASKRLLTAKEAAAYLGISLYTLKKIEHIGYLKPYHTPGGHRRYSKQMLDQYLEASREFSYSRETSLESGVEFGPRSNKGRRHGTG